MLIVKLVNMIKLTLVLITIISLSFPIYGQKLDSSLSKIDGCAFNKGFRVDSSLVESDFAVNNVTKKVIEDRLVNENLSDIKNIYTENRVFAVPDLKFENDILPRPLFAIKTNLLFDVVSFVNLELEMPIGERFSIAGEVVFPWWTFDSGTADSNRNRIHLLNINLEGRYWFGNRAQKQTMTGWFAGIYVGGGLFDFESNAKGYKSDFFIMGGISGGYGHTINKKGSLRMEYSLGVGYMQADYIYYEAHYSPGGEWHPVSDKYSRYSWFGPTRLKVSFVWMLNKGDKR